MPTLNANIPRFECFLRAEFLYDLDPARIGQFVPGVAHAVCSLEARVLGFHVLLNNGAHIGRVPIHALAWRENAEPLDSEKPWLAQCWNCMSYELAVTEFNWLAGCRVRTVIPTAPPRPLGADYLFTVDYFGSTTAESAGDAGWKSHHILLADNGWVMAQPNNRCCFHEPSCVVPFEAPPDYRTMTREFSCEDGLKFRPEDSSRMFYEIEPVDERQSLK